MMILNDATTDFYRIRNTWDPIDTDSSTTTQPTPAPSYDAAITSVSSSNWLTWDKDWYSYHAIRAFDGDPLTGWIEGSKGSGIGDYITLELDREITCDKIEVSPGLFDKRWWKDNNRIKELEVAFDNEKHIMRFNDIMKPQSGKFKEPVKFRKITFYVKVVYRAKKSNDTAISEIMFYYKGKEIELDLSKVKGYLEKKTKAEVGE
ncbi:MAG: hypothetical protein JW969_18825 [Spirochaetales bacterium]|nr:hypothetical protein [Spirochaetales bacterium]